MLSFIGRELSEDPNHFLAGFITNWAQGWSCGSQMFAALYPISHGVVKLSIVAVLLKGKLWAYHAGIFFFLAFIIYQLYRYSYTRSPWLVVLTVFDIAVIYLTWEEYKSKKKNGWSPNKRILLY